MKIYSCLFAGSGVLYIHEALASPAGETGANGLQVSVFRNAGIPVFCYWGVKFSPNYSLAD